MSVKLLACAAALVCALVVAAPAAASDRGSLKAEDFELRPPAEAAQAAASGGVISKPLTAPRRFDLVGLRWRGRAEPVIRLRVRARGERWTRWQMLGTSAEHNPDRGTGERHVAASDPVWAGGADLVQYRADRRLPGLRLHFVRVKGTASLAGPRARGAQVLPPAMVTRAQWGASQCPPRTGPSYGAVKAVHVHHTVSLNEYLPTDGPRMVLAICRYHRNSLGWNDIGYNALVDKYGVLYEGRAGGIQNAVMGAQAEGYNAQTAGIASIGDHTSVALSEPALATMANFIRWKLGHHGVSVFGSTTLTSTGGGSNRFPSGRAVTVPVVLGHRDTNATACPGNLLYAQLPALRVAVQTGVAPVLPVGATELRMELGAARADYRDEVPLLAILMAADGSPLANLPVTLETMTEGVWKTARRAVTGPLGEVNATLKPRKRMYVRARFAGGPDPRVAGATNLRPSGAARVLLHVRPTVRARSRARGRRGREITVKGKVAPRKRIVRLVLQQRIRGRWKRVGIRRVRTRRRGIFKSGFTPADAARYRFYVVADVDEDTDRARSDLRVVRVR